MAEVQEPSKETLSLQPAENFGVVPEDEGPVIELGDRIRILGGTYDGTKGRVVLRTDNEIHLMPDGVTNTVITFNIDEDGFDEEYGIESVEILQKRKKTALVDILDLAPGQILETFNPDGTKGLTYTITKVDSDLDIVTIKNEMEQEIEVPLRFRGLPDNVPFRVIRGRQAPEKPATPSPSQEEGDEAGNSEEEGAESGDEGGLVEYEDFTFLDDELEATVPAEEDEEATEYLIEIPRSERIYSNIAQKSEAYVDLLSLFPPNIQKSYDTQKKTRILTEIFFQLRSGIIRTSDDGIPQGIKPSSIQTLADLLDTRNLSISRPVIDIDKILYHDIDPDSEDGIAEKQPDVMDHLKLQFYAKKILDSSLYLTNSSDMEGQKFNSFMNSYLSKFAAAWRETDGAKAAFQRDEEAFRLKIPSQESAIPGYSILPNEKFAVSADLVSEVSISLQRCLKALRTRTQLIQLGEEASIVSHVIFPLAYANSLNTLRQESLVGDVEAGLQPFSSMAGILKKGEISDIPSSTQPFLIGAEGGTLGNIPLREYLKISGVKAEGLGDFWPLQTILGMKDREWTIDQKAILDEIVNKTHNAIYDVILRMRENLAKKVAQPAAVQGIQMVPEGPLLMQKLADEPLLKDIQQAIMEQMPSYSNSDVALVGLLLRQHSDFSMAQLAEQPAALAKSRMKYSREEYLRTIRNIQLTKERAKNAGVPPEPIKCPHVKPLAMIRKIKDNNTRLALLAKFLAKFQGSKADNWVDCRVGDHHLLCVHELLQVYQYLRPGDTATLNKDIQLTFGGGQFQGFYICRNCGQPISELEYDTHLEFDDNGKPMMGRAEIVDKDAITMQEIDEIIGPLGDVEEEPLFDNKSKEIIYATAKQMADKIAAPLELKEYMILVTRVHGVLQQIPSRERYIEIQKAQKRGKKGAAAAAAAAAAAEEAAGDYDIYINKALVCAVGVHLLLMIQCRKPDIMLRGTATGCKSLKGQPLEPDGGTQGIECIVGLIASFQKDSHPWNLTQFQTEKDEGMRRKMVMDVFEPILRSSLQDPAILQALSQKREYRRRILGAAGKQGRPDEQVPANFAPIPFVQKPEDFVEKVIIPEAASPQDRAELWVRQGNHLARITKLPKPTAFTETSCCLSPINQIDEYWKKSAASLPQFAPLTGLPAPPKITRSEPTMKPSIISRPLPDTPESSYYRLFLKVCFDGEKKGHSHEFGLTHKCVWCGLILPKEVKLLTPEQGRTAIEGQGIDVSKESFDDLLNETHRVNSFKTALILELAGQLDNWIALTKMEPEPHENYRVIMSETQVKLESLPHDAKDTEVAIALSDFSVFTSQVEEKFKRRIPATQYSVFDRLVEDGPESVTRFLQSYVIVPLKQYISKKSPFEEVPKSWGLSQQHKDDIESLIRAHRGYLTKFNKVETTPWLEAKVETALAQTRAILDALSKLRPLQVPGGADTYGFFLRFCLYAPLANFADPNTLPLPQYSGVEAPASQVEQQALFPAKFLTEMAARFKGEGFHLTPEQIREMIAERNEKEKANIIRKMNVMSRAERDIEKMKIKLGIGEYAVGGTKLIYAYDQDRYDIEREQRAEAGIIDFPGKGPYDEAGGDQRQLDGLGYYRTEGEEEGYIGGEMMGEINGFDDDN
jgi:hypothetical protein